MRGNDLYLFKEFESSYPSLIKNITSWYSYEDELVINMNDGSKLCYDNYDKTIRSLKVKDIYDADDQSTNEDWTQEFSIRLNRLLNKKRIAKIELSNITGISYMAIKKYTTGQGLPGIRNAIKIANALGCDIAYLTDFY